MEDREQLTDVCKALGITLVAFPVPWRPDGMMSDDKHPREHYLIALKVKEPGKSADRFEKFGYFSQGAFKANDYPRDRVESARKAHAPKVADVLYCLASDANGADRSFAEWCSDLGVEAKTHAEWKQARRTWKACKRTRKLLIAFLGDTFDRVCNAEH